jgi:mannose-6-phosphate isomerase-like protein (cupin superfamily)
MSNTTRGHLSVPEGVAQLPAIPAEQYAILFRHGTLTAGIYAPRGIDSQTPHTRDEVYVVAHGRGTFVRSDGRRQFAPGDLIFVPAREPHHFEDFTDDLVLWVLFYGPEGGEAG